MFADLTSRGPAIARHAAPRERARSLGRVPLHPPLIAAFYVSFLWSQNVREVPPADVVPVLGWALAATVAVWLLAALAFRDPRRGAFATSITSVVALSYGHVAQYAPPDLGVAVAGVAVAAAVAGVHALSRKAVEAATVLANVIAIALLFTVVPPLVMMGPTASGGAEDTSRLTGTSISAPPGELRDIYYVILDRYPRDDSLREVFGYDNSDFTGSLEALGFDVAEESLANYPRTAHSLASALNLTYLDDLPNSVLPSGSDDWRPLYRMLREHRVGDLLTAAGYEYVHVGTWWQPTSASAHADRVLTYKSGSEFTRLFKTTTIWPALEQALGINSPFGNREVQAAFTEHQFDVLDELARERSNDPRFVFAHLTVPHHPYVFEEDGSFVPESVELSRTRAEGFVRQLRYANRRIMGFVEELFTARPPGSEPIVIIQSDEGPHPLSMQADEPSLAWSEVPLSDLRERFRILNALYLPGIDDEAVPEGITPVNTFRLVLRQYLGAEDMQLLDDRSYVFEESRLYRFTEVTDRLRR